MDLMDGNLVDRLARSLTTSAGPIRHTRRAGLAALIVGALGLTVGAQADVAARRKRKRKRCKRTARRCAGNRKCCSKRCCRTVFGGKQCFPRKSRCCAAAQGGGACRNQGSCCGPRPSFPTGSCCPRGTPHCCSAPMEACCPPATPLCFPPTAAYPAGICCAIGAVYCDEFGCCAPGNVQAAAAGEPPATPSSLEALDAGAVGQ